MNKVSSLNKLIDLIYSSNCKLVVSNKDIKYLNDFFKDSKNFVGDFREYLEGGSEALSLIKKLKSGKYEMEKQYENNKALQAGILSECNYIETLARILKLNKCVDFDRSPLNSIPKDARIYLNSGAQTFSAARYLYYNPKIPDLYIFQYGNPANGDAEVILDGNKIRLEFKENNAKAGEYDITGLYDEKGKLLISDDFKKNTPEYIPLIEKFNKETNVLEQIGHNYSNFDEESKNKSILEYFNRHKIDAIISSTSNDDLILITPLCVNSKLSNGKNIILTDNSEIRTSGRNSTKVFTKELLNKLLIDMNAIEVSKDIYQVSLDNRYVELVNARGTNIPSRVKFNKIFFVKISKITIINNIISFNINDIEQLKPSISMHIKINASKEELKNFYGVE